LKSFVEQRFLILTYNLFIAVDFDYNYKAFLKMINLANTAGFGVNAND